MPERHGDLVAALRELGDRLDLPDGGATDPVAGALHRISAAADPTVRALPGVGARRDPRPRRSSRRTAVAAAAVVAVCAVVVAPGPRGAVARLLGIGGVRVVTTGEAPVDVAHDLDLGEAVPVARALDLAPAPMIPAEAGAPASAFAGQPDGGVTLVWSATDDLPEIDAGGSPGVGLVLTAFPGTPTWPAITKEVSPATTVQATTVGGRAGYWISGAPHEVHLPGPPGGPPDVVRLAGDTLLWTDGDTTYRLESALGREGAVAVAESIGAGGD